MARSPDRPGTYRILDRQGGRALLSGVRPDGSRVKVSVGNRSEAESMARSLFPDAPSLPVKETKPEGVDWSQTDEWGVPLKVTADVTAANAKLGLTPVTIGNAAQVQQTPTPAASKEVAEKRAARAKQAKSLMEMVGMGAAMGDVMLGRKLCEKAGKEPVKPNPTQVNDLADATRDTLTEWFGDREIKPWQMMILLGLALPVSMLIQAKPKPAPQQSEASQEKSAK